MANADNGNDAQAPSAASNISVDDRAASSLTVSWDAASDAGGSGLDRYAVTVDGRVVQTVDASTTETTLSGLSADTSYDVGVTAFDGTNNESLTVVLAVTTPAAGDDGADTGSGGSGSTGSGSDGGADSSGDSGGWWDSGSDSDSGSGWFGSGSGGDSDSGSGWWNAGSGSDSDSAGSSDSSGGWW